jgi:hypothetical protein
MPKRNSEPEIDLGNLGGGNESDINGPNGADNGIGGEAVDPGTASNATTASVGTDGGNGDTGGDNRNGRKRRSDIGRKRGPRGGAKAKASGLEVNGLSAILYSGHAMLAGITSTAELALDKAEADQLAKAAADVAQFYDVGVSGKTLAWINLTQCVGMIYGTRLFAIRQRRQNDRMRRPTGPAPQPAQRPGEVKVAPGSANGAKPAEPSPNAATMFLPSELNINPNDFLM